MLRLLALLFVLCLAACQDQDPSPLTPDGAPAQDAATSLDAAPSQPDANGGVDAAPPGDGGMGDGGMPDGGLDDGGAPDGSVSN